MPDRRKYVAFDLETATLVTDGVDWHEQRPLGITCAVAYAHDTETYTVVSAKNEDGTYAPRMDRAAVRSFVRYLQVLVEMGYTLLTWNGLAFDFAVLAEESDMHDACRVLAINHVDAMFHVLCAKGFPISLSAVAAGLDIPGKVEGMSGSRAPELWADGAYQEVIDYCAQDVRVTLTIARACESLGAVPWITKKGARSRLALPPEGLLPVCIASRLPRPDTSWMTGAPPSRARGAWPG